MRGFFSFPFLLAGQKVKVFLLGLPNVSYEEGLLIQLLWLPHKCAILFALHSKRSVLRRLTSNQLCNRMLCAGLYANELAPPPHNRSFIPVGVKSQPNVTYAHRGEKNRRKIPHKHCPEVNHSHSCHEIKAFILAYTPKKCSFRISKLRDSQNKLKVHFQEHLFQ